MKGGRKSTRPLVVGSRKLRKMAEQAAKRTAQREVDGHVVKMRLDHRTTVTVRTEAAMKMWLGKYPNAQILTA